MFYNLVGKMHIHIVYCYQAFRRSIDVCFHDKNFPYGDFYNIFVKKIWDVKSLGLKPNYLYKRTLIYHIVIYCQCVFQPVNDKTFLQVKGNILLQKVDCLNLEKTPQNSTIKAELGLTH